MSVERVEQAKRGLTDAKARLDSTLGALQHRLKPANLAGEAWDGVKDKSADLAEGAMEAARKRPGAVAAAVAAIGLFLAREPIRRGIARMISGDEEEDQGAHEELVTTRIETAGDRFNVLEPVAGAKVTGTRTKVKEGVD
jgi:hypothetical protein